MWRQVCNLPIRTGKLQTCRHIRKCQAASGEHPAALELWRRAVEDIAYIADHAGAVELRESFLQRADVRVVLAQAG